MKIITANVNGLRAAHKKGFWDWINQEQPDFLCLQEIRIQAETVGQDVANPLGYHAGFHYAEKKGYSGVALYSRLQPHRIQIGWENPIWEEFHREGRYVQFDFEQVSVISAYFPSGSSAPARQEAKMRFLSAMLPHLIYLKQQGREVLLCGDVNIAHTEKDIKNWKGNLDHSGFLPEERTWLSTLFTAGYHDIFRHLNLQDGQYTWWSNRGKAWENNAGWRIDYHIGTELFATTAQTESIYRAARFSDHAPLTIHYDLNFIK